MKKMKLAALAAALALTLAMAGCGAPSTGPQTAMASAEEAATPTASHKPSRSRQPKAPATVFTPAEAIAVAARDEDGARGVFEFKVASVGGATSGRGRSVFLNSEADYHDARNLTVMVRAGAVKELEATLGGPLDKTLAGRTIAVTGTARQAKINLYSPDRKKTGESMTQTRVIVAKADRIVVR